MWCAVALLLLLHIARGSSETIETATVLLRSSPSVYSSVPAGFTSFSGAEGTLYALLMPCANGSLVPRPSFTNLMRLLDGPNIRFGHFYGDGPDGQVPPYPAGMQMDSTLGASLSAALSAWSGSLTATVYPLDRTNASLVVDTATAMLTYMQAGLVAGIEVANEPDISSFAHNYSGYAAVWGMWAQGVAEAGLPLAPLLDAPVLAGGSWWPNMSTSFLPAQSSQMRHFVQHHYGLSACNHAAPTIRQLMEANLTEWNRTIPPALLASITGEYGLPFVVGEGNTVSCNGTVGVSDVYASALYALDTSLWALWGNASRYNWHGLGLPYPLFSYQPLYYDTQMFTQPGWDVAEVRPLFYGLWCLTDFAPRGSSVFPLALTLTPPSTANVAAWGVLQGQQERVLLINKQDSPVQVTVQPASPCSPGTSAPASWLLPGPAGLASNAGISYRNLTFDGTTDGIAVPVASPAPVPSSIACSLDGQWDVLLPPAAVVMLQLP